VTLALAVTAFVLLILRNEFLPDDPPFLLDQASFLITYLNRWLWIVVILGWGNHQFNRPMKWLPYATEAVFSWYILHQTITVVVGYNLTQLSLGPVIEPALVLIATLGGCLVIHEYIIRRSTILRPLFGLR